ncbi:MAG: radical SAM protein [Candidatus Parcubacteria bacterium]|nr:radical SAM protein [Candidatus Parcubacteria bacterium]
MHNTDIRFKVKLRAVNEHKIYWISITKYCNNNCLFCLDKDNRRSFFVDLKTINKQLNLAHKQGYTKLILSGGEPTLHPDLIKILGLARKNHFKNIQIISNGRMFADKKFAASCILGGISEFTLSLHSHDTRIQDRLMGGRGFGQQSQQGLANLIKLSKILKIPIIINIDIVLNKYNIKNLAATILYYSKNFQIYEFDLLFPIPFGQAFPNQNNIFFDIKENFSSLKKVFDLYRKNKRYYIWLNRFPAQYLRNYEDLIQDPLKILNELSGNKENIAKLIKTRKPFPCKNMTRCKLCHLEKICNLMHEYFLNFSKIKNLNRQPEPRPAIYLSEFLQKKKCNPQNDKYAIKLDDLKNFSDKAV